MFSVSALHMKKNLHVFMRVLFRSRGMTLVKVWIFPPPCRP